MLQEGQTFNFLRQVIITCLPKDNNDRKYTKNWCPISLLSVIYKMASTAIANQLKPYLNNVISKTQTAFISSRHIDENTSIVYDLLSYTEKNKSQAF